MVVQQGVLRAHQCEQAVLFQVEGRAQMDLGLVLRRVGEQSFARGRTTLLIDLGRCVYMDSTFLGTLLFLQRAAQRREGGLALISPSPECLDIMQMLGVTEVFAFRSREELAPEEWTELSAEVNDKEAFQCNVVQAHVELASLPGRAGERFKKAACILTQEMAARKAHEPIGTNRNPESLPRP